MHSELALVSLFAVASLVAIGAKRLKLPYTVALVIAGLVLGTIDVVEPPHLTKDLLYTVFLPGLLFEASFHLEFKKFWENKLAIHSLAVPGVLVSIVLTASLFAPAAGILHFEDGFRFVDGLVFGAILAATDPIAVVSLFKSLGAPKRLGVLIEGESLFNDGTAVVLVGIILTMALGTELSVPAATLEFVRVVGLGALIGAGIGFGASQIIMRVDDPMVEITLTTVAAWGSFIVAEQLHASGVIATVAAGMLCGNYAARTGMSPSTVVAAETFWEYVAFALNSIVFLLIGFEVHIDALLTNWPAIVVAWASVTLARAVVVYGVVGLLQKTKERVPWSWAAVLSWGGLRGGLSMVIVLSLIADFPHRSFLVTVTFGVVVLSILVQGMTVGPLLRRLKLIGEREDRMSFERDRAASAAAQAALEELEHLQRDSGIPPEALVQLRAEYGERKSAAEARVRDTHLAREELLATEVARARRHLLLTEKQRLRELVHQGLLTDEAAVPLLADVDARLTHLQDESLLAAATLARTPDTGAPLSATAPPTAAPPHETGDAPPR